MPKVRYDASGTVPEALKPYLVGEAPREDGEWDMYCPLHEDATRSAQFNIDQGIWFCHAGCGGGTIRDLLRRKPEWVPRSSVTGSASGSRARSNGTPEALSEADVAKWSAALLSNEARMSEFQELRGIWRKTIVDYEIGWDDARRAYTLPVRDRRGTLVNVRRYQPYPPPGRRKMWSVNGHGRPELYPASSLNGSEEIIICEGELDALITSQHGFTAVTRTASAITWKEYWNNLFKDKVVYVCHDCDKAGSMANKRVVEALSGVAREIRTIKLPYRQTEKHGKDLTDWWMEHDGDRDSFMNLIQQAKRGTVVKLVNKNGKLVNHTEKSIQRVDPFEWTEDGNARRFIEQHRGRLLYAPGVGWLRWSKQHYTHDSKDRRLWRPIPREMIIKDIKRTVRALREQAFEIDDREDQIAALKWAKRSLSTATLKNVRDSVEAGDPHIADLTVSIEELDSDPDIINTASGIVDLKTGKLRPHDPEELCTRITRVPYKAGARSAEWQKFLNRVIPDLKLQQQLQICLGASITGRPTRALFVLFGPEGENGKTQLVEAVATVLGTYSTTAMESTFTNASSREAGYDLADLRGVRFVSFSETREGHGLASERVKRITGDDMLKARSPYGKPFEYRPQFSLWVGTNHAPFIPAWERAMWKRIRVWPMFEVIPREEQIPDYGRKLAIEHGPAILAWLVAGAQAFYVNNCRLGRPPKLMEEQRDEWQSRDDIIGRWLDECTESDHRGRVSFKDLWISFTIWCEEQNEQRTLQSYTQRKFHEEMDQNHAYPRGPKVKGYPTRLGMRLIRGGLR